MEICLGLVTGKIRWFLIVPLLLFPLAGKGQYYFRMECDISIKHKVQGGEGSLVLGRAYYDKRGNALVYDIRFPEKEVWVVKDTTLTMIRNGVVRQSGVIDQYNQSTIFHKILEGRLNNYGLEGSLYEVEKVEKDGDLVVTSWKPGHSDHLLGKIYTSTLNNMLYGVAFFDPEGVVISRQLFKQYTFEKGLGIPTEIIQVFYRDSLEEYQVYSLSNIRINHLGNENMYNYPVPGM